MTHSSRSVGIFFVHLANTKNSRIPNSRISDEQTISHGLETLIEYYQTPNRGLNVTLTNPIIKDQPPPETRMHGRTNLLHRATREGI